MSQSFLGATGCEVTKLLTILDIVILIEYIPIVYQ